MSYDTYINEINSQMNPRCKTFYEIFRRKIIWRDRKNFTDEPRYTIHWSRNFSFLR